MLLGRVGLFEINPAGVAHKIDYERDPFEHMFQAVKKRPFCDVDPDLAPQRYDRGRIDNNKTLVYLFEDRLKVLSA